MLKDADSVETEPTPVKLVGATVGRGTVILLAVVSEQVVLFSVRVNPPNMILEFRLGALTAMN
jgi:hypothetical protein